jgi:hypothetical protein
MSKFKAERKNKRLHLMCLKEDGIQWHNMDMVKFIFAYKLFCCILKVKVKFSPLQALEALRVVRG